MLLNSFPSSFDKFSCIPGMPQVSGAFPMFQMSDRTVVPWRKKSISKSFSTALDSYC